VLRCLGIAFPRILTRTSQIGVVYSGKAELRIGDEQRVVQKGDFYCIPANTPHSDTCVGEKPFVMLDIFYPIREDFIEKLKNST